MRPRIREITDEYLDQIAAIAANGGNVDLVEHLARPVPLAVICELLGLPDEDRPKFKKWFSAFANIGSMWGIFRAVPGLRKTMKYLSKQFEIVRKQPRDGLITALVQAEQDGEQLTDDELLSMAMLLLLAGHETTVHLISSSILTLLQKDDLRKNIAGRLVAYRTGSGRTAALQLVSPNSPSHVSSSTIWSFTE